MLDAKFQDHSTSGSGDEDFKGFLPYIGMVAILVISDLDHLYKLPPPPPHLSQGGST